MKVDTFPRLDKDNMIPQPPPHRIIKETGLLEFPNPEKHKIISFIKSGVRIIGYSFLLFNIKIAVMFLVLSEVVGVIEEMV